MHGGQHAEIITVGNSLKIQRLRQSHVKTGRMSNGLAFGIAISIIWRVTIAENIAVKRQKCVQMRFAEQTCRFSGLSYPLQVEKNRGKTAEISVSFYDTPKVMPV